MSRGRASNHLYIVGGAAIDDATGHGPRPVGIDPVEAVQQALTFETDKRLAIDTGDPIANWPIEDLVAEKHRLRRILDACPPDRTHDIRSLTARRDQLAAEVEALADRYDYSGSGVLSRTKCVEHRDLGRQLGDGTSSLSKVGKELHTARGETARHDLFQVEHAADAAQLTLIERTVEYRLSGILDRQVIDRPRYIVRARFEYRPKLRHLPPGGEAHRFWRRIASGSTTIHQGQPPPHGGERIEVAEQRGPA